MSACTASTTLTAHHTRDVRDTRTRRRPAVARLQRTCSGPV
jgi:hypothetical protein